MAPVTQTQLSSLVGSQLTTNTNISVHILAFDPDDESFTAQISGEGCKKFGGTQKLIFERSNPQLLDSGKAQVWRNSGDYPISLYLTAPGDLQAIDFGN